MKMLNVLVAEDHPLNLMLIERLLKKMEINVCLAVNGKDALEKYNSYDQDWFDLIIMDINMPELNGIEAIKEIRKQNDNVPIYIMTGDCDNYDEIISEVNIQGYIDKPIDRELLNLIIDKYKN